MKKIILLLGMLLLTNSVSMAACEYNCVEPYNMNSGFRTFWSGVSGLNFATEKAAQKILEREISKVAKNDFLDVKLDSYSAKDLKNGKFKSLSVTGKNVNINDIYMSDLSMSTLCDFNYIKQADGDVVFMEDFPMAFKFVMKDSDINKTIKSNRYQKIINDLNNLANSYGVGIKISSSKISIKANKLYYVIGLSIPFVRKEQRLIMNSDLCVKNGKIDFVNTKLVSDSFVLDMKKIDFILNYLNPLDFSVNILDNKDAKVSVENVDIRNNAIVADGIVVIPKD